MNVTDKRLGRVYGLHRCYRISSPIGRGIPEKLSLTLCLEQGSSATGMALRIDRKSEEEELSILWDREMSCRCDRRQAVVCHHSYRQPRSPSICGQAIR